MPSVAACGPRGGSRRLSSLDGQAEEVGCAPGRGNAPPGNIGDAVHCVGSADRHGGSGLSHQGSDSEADGVGCPLCGDDPKKVIYMGFPMKLCGDDQCNCLGGFWSWVPALWFNGWFMQYDGCYLPALWEWLFGGQGE